MGRSGVGGGGGSRGSRGSSSHRGSMGRSSNRGGRSGISGGGSFHAGGPSFGGGGPHFHPPYRSRRPHVSAGVSFYGGGWSRTSNLIIAIVIIVMILIPAISSLTTDFGSITESTVSREPLPAGSVVETDYYTDTAGWITNPSELESGMKYFYQKTGIQPYVYITEEVDGSRDPSDEQMDTFASSLYDELFTDEAHLLLVFQDADGHYYPWVITGAQAKQVADNEAVTILFDYIDRYYYDTSLSSEAFFSKAFRSTADRMMSKTISPFVIAVVCITAGFIVIIVANIISKVIKQKREADERTERILNTDLSDQVEASPGLKDLEDKYK